MKRSLEDDGPAVGLRERKKAKTRALIQEQALRLFQEQGYAATTVEQIAEAAEVSPSTFFRYFPTKEDVVLYDVIDPLLYEAFRAQPADVRLIPAMRAALHRVFETLPAAELVRQRERAELIMGVPELRMRMLDEVVRSLDTFAAVVAERVGRQADDFAVRTFVGALVGGLMAVWLNHPMALLTEREAYLDLADRVLVQLEAGLPL